MVRRQWCTWGKCIYPDLLGSNGASLEIFRGLVHDCVTHGGFEEFTGISVTEILQSLLEPRGWGRLVKVRTVSTLLWEIILHVVRQEAQAKVLPLNHLVCIVVARSKQLV